MNLSNNSATLNIQNYERKGAENLKFFRSRMWLLGRHQHTLGRTILGAIKTNIKNGDQVIPTVKKQFRKNGFSILFCCENESKPASKVFKKPLVANEPKFKCYNYIL